MRSLSIILVISLSFVIVLSGPRVLLADSINDGVYAIDSKPYGKSYEDWTIEFWQWLVSIPVSRNPAVDQTGEFCQEKQGELPVFFLVFTGSGAVDRVCNVPAGKAILIPINVVECSFVEFALPAAKTEEDLHKCATEDESSNPGLSLSVDGREFKELEKYRVHSRAFNFTLPTDPWFGVAGTTRAVSDGYWVILEPLPPGKHEINWHGSLTDLKTGIISYSTRPNYIVNVS